MSKPRVDYVSVPDRYGRVHVLPSGVSVRRAHTIEKPCWCDPDFEHDDYAVTSVYLHHPEATE